MADIYCYEGTNVLKNKLNIKDKNKLFDAEIELTAARLQELQKEPIRGNFDFNHLCKIHKHIFQDLYSWAGKPRTIDIAKGSLFCLSMHLQTYADSIFSSYKNDCIKAKNNKEQFIKTLSAHYADLNALHPFREGNGRAQREFARELCMECGYVFDLNCTKHKEMLLASIASLDKGDNKGLNDIFKRAVIPVHEYTYKKSNILQILSFDDIPKPKHKKRPLPKLPQGIDPDTLKIIEENNYYGYNI